jgi:hypothetical protein
MSLHMGFRPFVVCSALLALSQIAPAQVKVAVIDTQKAVFETAEIKKADADLQATLKPRNDRALQLNAELQSIQQQLQTGGSKLTQQQSDDLQSDGQRDQRFLDDILAALFSGAVIIIEKSGHFPTCRACPRAPRRRLPGMPCYTPRSRLRLCPWRP